jgi:hypothetical protein
MCNEMEGLLSFDDPSQYLGIHRLSTRGTPFNSFLEATIKLPFVGLQAAALLSIYLAYLIKPQSCTTSTGPTRLHPPRVILLHNDR